TLVYFLALARPPVLAFSLHDALPIFTAGFVHRAGRTASTVDRHITDARVEEHRNLGIAFYKTGMLDEAAREFRRVAELRKLACRSEEHTSELQSRVDLVFSLRLRKKK